MQATRATRAQLGPQRVHRRRRAARRFAQLGNPRLQLLRLTRGSGRARLRRGEARRALGQLLLRRLLQRERVGQLGLHPLQRGGLLPPPVPVQLPPPRLERPRSREEGRAVLKNLNISRNHIGGYYDHAQRQLVYTPEGPTAIAEALKVNGALKSALLSRNYIGDGGTAALCDALKTNSTLETLELRSNEISAAGAQSLASMLQVNGALTSLGLRLNEIGAGGAKAIAAALPQS